jgi:RHS repeat-associated protein
VIQINYTNHTKQEIGYDSLTGRLANMHLWDSNKNVLRATDFTFDLVGNLLQINSQDPKLKASYTYDDLYRLIIASTGNGENRSYSYDDSGNLTHKSDVGDYHYGGQGVPATCLTSAGSQIFTYDEFGYMKQTPWGIQTFDAMGRMTQITSANNQRKLHFLYDYKGKRVVMKGTGGGGQSIELITPDDLFEIESGTLVMKYFYVGGVAARQKDGNSMVFLHTDHLGGLALTTDESGEVTDSIRYDPFGNVLDKKNPSSFVIPMGFIGGIPEPVSGLLYLNARYYHPVIGRFISPDPIVQDIYDPVAWPHYVYCGNNPTSYIDPTGRSFWRIFLSILALAALVVVSVFAPPAIAGVVAVGVALGGIIGGVVSTCYSRSRSSRSSSWWNNWGSFGIHSWWKYRRYNHWCVSWNGCWRSSIAICKRSSIAICNGGGCWRSSIAICNTSPTASGIRSC